MGVFDYVTCKYPLPWPEAAGFKEPWQSKDTPAQYCDEYELREDGTLWYRRYDARVEADPKAPLGFWRYQDNPRWEQVKIEGELEIYNYDGGVEYSVRLWFKDGKVADLICKKRDR